MEGRAISARAVSADSWSYLKPTAIESGPAIIWVLAGPGPYLDLVGRRRWTAHDYEQWLNDQLRGALLDDAANGRSATPIPVPEHRDTEEEPP